MFKPINDLESLTPEQRQEYYLTACEYFGVPPEMRLLDFIYMDSFDGKRNLVLYAKKGATDLIRANLLISTTKLIKDVGDGYVAWIAEGRDRNGRVEQAVGSASTYGLKGQSLSSAVMVAQTRATRRMTLQFVGGGLLDESELNETTVDINRANTSLASMATLPAPQPTVTPNAEAGKDVTSGLSGNSGLLGNSGIPGNGSLITRIATGLPESVGTLSPEAMIVPTPFSGGSIIPESSQSLQEAEAELEPKKRRRRTKAEMEAAKVDVIDIVEAPDKSADKVPVVSTVDAVAESTFPILNQIVEVIKADAEYPNSDQEAEYRKKLQVWVDILKAAGMTGGINWRLKRYTLAKFPDALVDNGRLKLTVKQWDALLFDFEEKECYLGSKALVAEINAIAEKV